MYSLFIASPSKFDFAARIANYNTTKSFDLNWSAYGWGTNFDSRSSETELVKSGKTAASRHQKNDLLNEKSIGYFDNIIDLCKKNKIKLLFVTTPAYHTYRSYLKSELLNNFDKLISKKISNDRNVKYINYLQDKRFDSSDFYDADHLNHLGAAKFSKIIDNDIENFQSGDQHLGSSTTQ